MNKKGFTLVELLAVITILGIISIIIIPGVDKSIKNMKNKAYNAQKESLIMALKDFKSEHQDLFYETNTVTVTLYDLKSEGFVDYDIKDPKTDRCLSNNMEFKITLNDKKYEYEIKGDELLIGDESDCNNNILMNSEFYLLGDSTIYSDEIGEDYVDAGVTFKGADGNTVIVNNVTYQDLLSISENIYQNHNIVPITKYTDELYTLEVSMTISPAGIVYTLSNGDTKLVKKRIVEIRIDEKRKR